MAEPTQHAGTAQRGRAAFAAIGALYLALAIGVALTAHEKLWFIDEELYLGQGARILHSGRIGTQVDTWNPPLSYLIHGSLLAVHPLTPDLSGEVPQDPGLPPDDAPVPGMKNPMLRDSVTHALKTSVETAGASFARYVFWARLPMVLCGLVALAFLWRFLEDLGADPWAGTALAATSVGFFVEHAKVLGDALVAGLLLGSAWASWMLARQPTWKRAALLGLVLGLGVATKLSSLPALGACALMAFAFRRASTTAAREDGAGPRGMAMTVRRLAPRWALAMACAALVTWAAYGFQVGSLAKYDALHRPGAAAPTSLVSRFPALARVPVPMPSFAFAFRTNQIVVATGDHVKIDLQRSVPAARKLRHFAGRLSHDLGPALLLAALSLGMLLRSARGRWLALGLAALPALYLASAWAVSLALVPRRLVPIVLFTSLLAGLAWRPAADPEPRWWPLVTRLRVPLLALHLAWNAKLLVDFMS